MEKEILDDYRKAGEIVSTVEGEIRKILKPGLGLLELAETIEKRIHVLGGKPAFPVNISVNDTAAHYTPTFNDARVIGSTDLVKVDFGVHVDGYIADRAFTYCAEKNELVVCVEEALEAALKIIRPGLQVSDLGKTIQDMVESRELGLIVNLTGHGLDKFVFHGNPSIPNVRNNNNYKLKEGDVIALEPFVTKKNGHVREAGLPEIYRFLQARPVRLMEARKILELGANEYGSLPFAKRWLYKKFAPIKISLALRQLEEANALETFPPLREVSGMPIAQAEHTIIVQEKPIVITKG